MYRIRPLSAMILPVVAALMFAVAACGSEDTPGPGAAVQTPESTSNVTPPRPTLTLAPGQLNLELEGDGSQVHGPVTMSPGVVIAFVRYNGASPFSMTFLGQGERVVKSVESRAGPYNGERVHSVFEGSGDGLNPGEYTVEVEADGPWRLRLFQERASGGQPPTVTLSGSGDGGGSWLRLDDGQYTMTTIHTGDSNFSVELFDSVGLPPYRMVEAAGDHQGESRFTVGGGAPGQNPQAGFYAMGVRSEGDWEVTIESNDVP